MLKGCQNWNHEPRGQLPARPDSSRKANCCAVSVTRSPHEPEYAGDSPASNRPSKDVLRTMTELIPDASRHSRRELPKTIHANEDETATAASHPKQFSVSNVLVGAGAAATTAVLGLYFGPAGTVAGAAIGPVANTLAHTLHQRFLGRPMTRPSPGPGRSRASSSAARPTARPTGPGVSMLPTFLCRHSRVGQDVEVFGEARWTDR